MDEARACVWALVREITVNVDQRCLQRCIWDALTDSGASSLFECAAQFLRIIASFSRSAFVCRCGGAADVAWCVGLR